MQPLKPICLACVSFDVEAIVDDEPAEIGLFACFECRDVFYFMPDAQPRATASRLVRVVRRARRFKG